MRSGARPGDRLYVTGRLGGPALAIAAWTAGRTPAAADRERFVRPAARIEEARWLASHGATAALDVSDGLVGDCDKICAASGCSAVIEADKVPLAPGLVGSGQPGLVARFLTHGEDFEILCAVPANKGTAFEAKADAVGVPVTEIGKLVEGQNLPTVLFEGRPLSLTRRAFVHGAGEKR